MATSGRRTDSGVEESLFQRGFEFEFFQAVRLLARVFPDRRPVGGTARPSDEVVRFGSWLSLAFPASAVDFIERTPDSDRPVRMTVTFMALTGIQGILPIHYTERLMAARTGKNNALADFLDIFNHRLLSLFYRAWAKHNLPALYEAGITYKQRPDPFTHSLFDLVGLGTSGLRGRMHGSDEGLLRYAGVLAQRPHSASMLRGVLQNYFSVPVVIEQCIGSWYELEDRDRCFLGPQVDSSQLGEAAFCGDKVWDQQSRFRIRLGPLPFERFRKFLPDSPALARVVELTTFIVGQSLAFDIQVILQAAEVPYCRLSDSGHDAPRLGWTGWLKTNEFPQDAGDAVFTMPM